MAFQGTLLQKLTVSGGEVTPATIPSFTGDAKDQRQFPVTTGQTDYLVAFSLDVSSIQVIIIVSDQDITLETNNGTTPDETINLLANNPYIWYTGSYFTNLLATDITALYFTNASGATATVNILVLSDSTPT